MAISSDAISGLVGVVVGSAITGGFQLGSPSSGTTRAASGPALDPKRTRHRSGLRQRRRDAEPEDLEAARPADQEEAWVRYGDGLARDRPVEYGKLNAAYHAVRVVLALATVGTPPGRDPRDPRSVRQSHRASRDPGEGEAADVSGRITLPYSDCL